MGRAERPLNPEAGTVERFAYDLRRLRERAGTPPYRTLARRTNYSVTSLSQAAAGRALPSLAVTLAFVRACGGDPEEWNRRWHDAEHAITLAVPPCDDATREPDWILSAEPQDAAAPAAPPVRKPPERRPWTRIGFRPAVVAMALLVAATAVAVPIAAVVTVAVVWIRDSAPSAIAASSSPQSQPGKTDPVADGSDPTRAGCGTDAVTMASTRVHFPTDQLSGQVDLRYSPHCHAAWGRFEPADGWRPGPGTMVTVWTIRPADQATQSYSVEFGGESVIGNLLMTARGCVAAEVTVARGQVMSPVATTVCVSIS